MSDLTSNIVDRAISHAQSAATTARYDWLTTRTALSRILADLETRFPGDPNIERLRNFISETDQASRRRPARGREPKP